MISGFFGESVAVDGFPGISKLTNPKGDEDSLFFEIELISSDGLELPVDALFDTGFSASKRY